MSEILGSATLETGVDLKGLVGDIETIIDDHNRKVSKTVRRALPSRGEEC